MRAFVLALLAASAPLPAQFWSRLANPSVVATEYQAKRAEILRGL